MLCTLSELKTALAISGNDNDAQLTSCITSANALIASYIGADLSDVSTDRVHTTTAETNADFIQLNVWPVISVGSVTVDGEALDPTKFRLLPERGELDFLDGLQKKSAYGDRFGVRVTAVFKAGYAVVPPELNAACLNIAAALYNNGGTFSTSGGKGELKSMTMFDAMSMSFETGGASAVTPASLLDAWKPILNVYRCYTPVLA